MHFVECCISRSASKSLNRDSRFAIRELSVKIRDASLSCFVFMFAAASLLFFVAGCKGDADRESFSLDKMIKDMYGPSGKELAEMAVDPNDPDRRREGISKLSSKSWGRKDPYLSVYSMILRRDKDASVRSAAARALGLAEDTKYIPDLAAALTDESEAVRWDAAVALGQMPGEESVAPLKDAAVGDTSADVRMAAVKALGKYRRRDVLVTLTKCLDDPSFGVRFEAHEAMVTITGVDRGYEVSDWEQFVANFDPNAELPSESGRWWKWFGEKDKKDGSLLKDDKAGSAVKHDNQAGSGDAAKG